METEDLYAYIQSLLGSSFNLLKVQTQVKGLLKSGWSVQKIYDVAQYWYEVRKGSVQESHGGIGILYYLEDEYQEYLQQKKQQEEALQKAIKRAKQAEKNVKKKSYKIPPKPIRKPRGINWFDLE